MIELVKPEWVVGSERRFYNFIKKINEKDRIAIISHTDPDGLIAAKIINKVLGSNLVKFITHSDLNDSFLGEMKKQKINKIFITDITFGTRKFLKKFEKFAKVVIVDHHKFDEDLNTTKTVFLDSIGFCSAYLCYYLLSKVQNLENIDWLVVCASLSDWAFKSNQKWMSDVYNKYKMEFSLTESKIKSGKFWDTQYILFLATIYFYKDLLKCFEKIKEDPFNVEEFKKYSKVIDQEIARQISEFYIKKEDLRGGYFMEFQSEFPSENLVVNLLSQKEVNKTFFIGKKYGNIYKITARRQDGEVNLPELFKKLTEGFEDSSAGGHVPAAGCHFPIEYLEEFKKRMKKL